MQILQQFSNIALSIKKEAAHSHTKPINTSKLTTGHFFAHQREAQAKESKTLTGSDADVEGLIKELLNEKIIG